MLRLPTEMLQQIYDEFKDDWAALAVHSTVCRRLSRLIRPSMFSKQLTFRNKDHLLEFVPLMSAPTCTIPKPVVCRNICFLDIASMAAAAGNRDLATLIRVQRSFTLPLPHGRTLLSTHQLLGAWSSHIRQLILVGENHTTAEFFKFVSLFTQLESLVLRRFSLKEGATDPQETRNTFPQTLTHLSLDQSPCMLTTLRDRIAAQDSTIRDLYIRSAFSMDQAGVVAMLDIMKELRGVETITLDALYDELDSHLYLDMKRLFSPKRLLQVPGLKHLRLNLEKVPSEIARDFLGWCSMYHPKPPITAEVIDIYVPSSPSLWLDGSPSHELHRALESMGLCDPAGRAHTDQTATFVVRGFPEPLPQYIQAWGGSADMSGYTLSFGDSDGERIAEERLQGF